MAIISDDNVVKKGFLLPGDVISLLTALLSLPVIAIFFWQRLQEARNRRTSIASITLLLSYVSAFCFILILTTIIHVRAESLELCDADIVLCLTLYVFSKTTGFAFLIERVYVISWPVNPRHQSLEYILSSVCIYAPYAAVAGLAIAYRVSFYVNEDVCIIGIRMFALVALMLVEVLSYLYLTLRFLIPLLLVHKDGHGLLSPLRKIVRRTCIGTAIAMISVLTVKISLTLFNGEPAWLCCMTCRIDAFIGCCVFHWITKPDRTASGENAAPQALGIGFDKDSTTVVPEDSGSDRTVCDSPQLNLKGGGSSL